jgi:putative PD-(D/E)XK family protein DUF4420
MTRLDESIWNQLTTSLPVGSQFTARLAVPDISDRLLVGVDSLGQRHLLVRLDDDEEGLQDSNSRGLQVATNELSVVGGDAGRYLDVACKDSAAHAALDLIGGELAERLSSKLESPAEAVSRILAKWRRFWGQIPQRLLSREEQIGLYAELWFLAFWLLPCVATKEAVSRWRGPFGARHDFEWQGRSVEVKAATSVRAAIHSINGLEQLAKPESGDLLFFSLRLREEAGATDSLLTVVQQCRAQLGEDDEAVTMFESALARCGYSPAHEDDYDKTRLRVVTQSLYRVEEDFPRLTPSLFHDGVPAGVEYVQYDINLDSFSHLLFAKDPSGVRL